MSADLAIGVPQTRRPAKLTQAFHLAPETLPRWRALLESHWRARLERVTELSLAYHDAEEARAGQEARTGREARAGQEAWTGQEVSGAPSRPLLRQAVVERRALAEIEEALARLGKGGFGRCERCGSFLSATRLTRTPQARYCGSCEAGPDGGRDPLDR
ncbi:MAG: TraR/DksA family transcriptional regulator [Streptosporangiaceae bacterium]